MRKYIPNTITSMNLLCGAVGVVFALKGRFDIAFILMICGGVCDFCDGLAARALKAYSPMGKELDSLSDMVTFGVLPSMMLYKLMCVCTFSECWPCFIPLLIAVFSGLRLAKFNIDERQTKSFIGLATPACAIICGSLSYFIAYEPVSFLATWATGYVFIPVLSLVLCALLVSEIPMFSMKGREKGILCRKRIAFGINVALIVAIVAIVGLNWSMIPLLSFVVYALMNIAFAIFKI